MTLTTPQEFISLTQELGHKSLLDAMMCDLDLEKGTQDEPLIVRPLRSTSMILGMRTHTVSSNLSTRSLFQRPVDLFKRFTANGKENSLGTLGGSDDTVARQRFVFLLTGGINGNKTLSSACIWYTSYLESQFEVHWDALTSNVNGLSKGNTPKSSTDVAVVYRMLKFVGEQLSRTDNLALVGIVDELLNNEYIHEEPDSGDERAVLSQLTFILIGWLCMLYTPVVKPEILQLQVQKYYHTSAGSKNTGKSRVFENDQQNFDNNDQPLYTMLGRFGTLIPEAVTKSGDDFASPSDWITVPFVCYHTLRKVCRINIVWVDNMAMHLEFDSTGKVLKVFRFPSFARLHYKHKERTILAQLFEDNARDISGEISTDYAFTSKYFREMLLTYRLIFGQDSESWRLFSKETGTLSKSGKRNLFSLEDADPLLAILCGKSCDSQEAASLYDDIYADGVQPYYTTHSFPYFSKRLLMLQGYVREQHPHNWKTLWYDHRDKANWWQFWAVLFIGGGTIILSVFSLVFQIWQVVLTQRQLATPGIP